MKLRSLFTAMALMLFSLPAMADNFLAGQTVPLTASSSSSRVQMTNSLSASLPDVMVVNGGSVIAFVGCGDSSVTANVPGVNTLNATPVPPGAIVIFRKGSAVYCAGITSTSTTSLYFTAGIGE